VVVAAGRHEVERINNPHGKEGTPWLVLKGTMIGAAETWWKMQERRRRIEIEDLNGKA
jgi:hypothetical protein